MEGNIRSMRLLSENIWRIIKIDFKNTHEKSLNTKYHKKYVVLRFLFKVTSAHKCKMTFANEMQIDLDNMRDLMGVY